MKINSLILIFVFIFLFFVISGEEVLFLNGYIMDNLCKDFMLKKYKGRGDMKFVKKHKKYCCLLPQCIKSGYSLYTLDGRIYEISEKSSEIIINFLKEKGNTAFVQIDGQILNSKLFINKIIKIGQNDRG